MGFNISSTKLGFGVKKIIRPAQEELLEIKKTAVNQLTSTDKHSGQNANDQVSPIVEAMQQTSTDASVKNDPKKITPRRHISIIRQQEEDMQKAQRNKQELEKIMREVRDPEPENAVESKPGQPMAGSILPKSKPSRGAPAGSPQSPETRKGKH